MTPVAPPAAPSSKSHYRSVVCSGGTLGRPGGMQVADLMVTERCTSVSHAHQQVGSAWVTPVHRSSTNVLQAPLLLPPLTPPPQPPSLDPSPPPTPTTPTPEDEPHLTSNIPEASHREEPPQQLPLNPVQHQAPSRHVNPKQRKQQHPRYNTSASPPPPPEHRPRHQPTIPDTTSVTPNRNTTLSRPSPPTDRYYINISHPRTNRPIGPPTAPDHYNPYPDTINEPIDRPPMNRM
ncbi:hypothetical protein BDK51DRAFT_44978 [Blyttiomyces helicus]|uniref:Uncharacterized protein n=1 Tax=Blyttiomyces helicus TaxID=388810 RepID=A0A4P9WQG1_9FUNG|nr:hypothetical protein BDK51DRAFT_44978 [Blyttiomyces helicus]|eukprot:RKO94048.1 hypothetical protein BDK51DRAFT_44978 [Blyttiomyces helicus]